MSICNRNRASNWQRKHADASNTLVVEPLIWAERRMKVHTLTISKHLSRHYALVFEDSDTSKETQMGPHSHTHLFLGSPHSKHIHR
jgi:hypothetical protein